MTRAKGLTGRSNFFLQAAFKSLRSVKALRAVHLFGTLLASCPVAALREVIVILAVHPAGDEDALHAFPNSPSLPAITSQLSLHHLHLSDKTTAMPVPNHILCPLLSNPADLS